MSVIGERQVTGGSGRNPSGQKVGYPLDMEGFWLSDKFRIIARPSKKPISACRDLLPGILGPG